MRFSPALSCFQYYLDSNFHHYKYKRPKEEPGIILYYAKGKERILFLFSHKNGIFIGFLFLFYRWAPVSGFLRVPKGKIMETSGESKVMIGWWAYLSFLFFPPPKEYEGKMTRRNRKGRYF